MNKLFLKIAKYTATAFFILGTVGSLGNDDYVPAVIFLAGTLLLIPFTARKINKIVHKKWKYNITGAPKAFLLLAIVVLGFSTTKPTVKDDYIATEPPVQTNQVSIATPINEQQDNLSTVFPTNTQVPSTAPLLESPTPKAQTNAQPQTNVFEVTRVIDGDTIDVSINGKTERIRLIGVNTPETVDPRTGVQCFGKEASNKAKEILSNKSVRLEADPTQGDRDTYNRLLRYVIMESGINFNLQMIQEGYAFEYTYRIPYKYQNDFKAAERNARDNKIGLWADNTCQGTLKSTNTATSKPATNTQTTTSNTSSKGDKDCKDFKTQAEAQAYFNSKGGSVTNNIDRLDGNDKDGIVCESLP